MICDDTNLTRDAMSGLTRLAACLGVQVRIEDFTGVPVGVCIARDAQRSEPVGAAVIERMWAAYQADHSADHSADGGGDTC